MNKPDLIATLSRKNSLSEKQSTDQMNLIVESLSSATLLMLGKLCFTLKLGCRILLFIKCGQTLTPLPLRLRICAVQRHLTV